MADCIDDIINCKSRIVLMGDYKINYLNEKEKQSLDLAPANKTTPTHIQHKSGTLIDYIFTDRSLECLKTVFFETPIESKHLATVLICNKNIEEKSNLSFEKYFRKNIMTKIFFVLN